MLDCKRQQGELIMNKHSSESASLRVERNLFQDEPINVAITVYTLDAIILFQLSVVYKKGRKNEREMFVP